MLPLRQIAQVAPHSPWIGSDFVVGAGALAARCLVGGLSVAGRLPQDGPPGGVRHRVRFGDARLGRRGACSEQIPG